MNSRFAFLRSLVLPFGATSGRRIIIDGVNGKIEVYDAANNLVGYFGPDGLLDMLLRAASPAGHAARMQADATSAQVQAVAALPENPSMTLRAVAGAAQLVYFAPDWPTHTRQAGTIQADIETVAGYPFLVIGSPRVDGLTDIRLFLRGENTLVDERPRLIINAGDGESIDVEVDGSVIGNGARANVTSNVNGPVVGAEQAIFQINNFLVRRGRAYRWSCGRQMNLAAVGVAAQWRVRRNGLAGAVVSLPGAIATAAINGVDGSSFGYFRNATTADITDNVTLTLEGLGGNVQQVRAAPDDRYFLIEDCGGAAAYPFAPQF